MRVKQRETAWKSMEERGFYGGHTKKLAQCSYLLFFFLMIFAKGIGLDSGDRLYYLLGGAACLCVGGKLLLTPYSKKEILTVCCLLLAAGLAYFHSGRLGIVLSVLAITGMKGMDRKQLFRLGTVVYGASFFCMVLLSGYGLIENPMAVHEKGGIEVIRWGMGYSTGNVFHVSYFILLVLLCLQLGKNFRMVHLGILMAGNLIVFAFSLSYTGAAVSTIYLLLNFYAVRRKKLSAAEKVLCQCFVPACVIFSYTAPFLLEYPLVRRLDALLQARLSFSAHYLQHEPLTLLGGRMTQIPEFWIIMDNGYVYCLMTFGVLFAGLFVLGYGRLIAGYSGWRPLHGQQEEKLQELAVIFSYCLYGIMEQFITNAFMNLSLFFLAELLFVPEQEGESRTESSEIEGAVIESSEIEGVGIEGSMVEGSVRENSMIKSPMLKGPLPQKKQRPERWGRWLAAGAAAGLLVFGISIRISRPADAIRVPVSALRQVDAVSRQLHISNPANDKQLLLQEMAAFQELLEQPEILQGALEAAGLEEVLTPEQLQAALEYSLPVFVDREERYDTFRVRCLKLYHRMSEEAYTDLLEWMTGQVAAQTGEQYRKEAVYQEQVGYSFGEDRIQHMSKDRDYLVEKTGVLPLAEQWRQGLLHGITAWLVVWLAGMAVEKLAGSKKAGSRKNSSQ